MSASCQWSWSSRCRGTDTTSHRDLKGEVGDGSREDGPLDKKAKEVQEMESSNTGNACRKRTRLCKFGSISDYSCAILHVRAPGQTTAFRNGTAQEQYLNAPVDRRGEIDAIFDCTTRLDPLSHDLLQNPRPVALLIFHIQISEKKSPTKTP